jgi:hypothetical protein
MGDSLVQLCASSTTSSFCAVALTTPPEAVTLAEIRRSSGTVRRIWVTINDRSPAMLRGLKIEMSWDGAIKQR